jgi:hypothetical protein
MAFVQLQQLPVEVQDLIFSDNLTDQNLKIADKFDLDQDQLNFILDLEEEIWLKRVDVLNLLKELEKINQGEDLDIRQLALELAVQILWPLQEYLKDVDRLILRLGGKVPRMKHLRKPRPQNATMPSIAKGAIKFLLEQYPDLKDKRLSSKKIIAKDGRRVMPTVDNWIEDYVHFLGAGYHNSLQRSKYLAKSLNILATDEDERENLRHFFTSYDDGLAVKINSDRAILTIKEIQEDKEKEEKKEPVITDILKKIHTELINLEQKIISEDIILSEAEGSINKLRDVLWRSLALQDKDKVISCLKVLITKKALDSMVREDRRFQGIMRRFISIRYGEQAQFDYSDKLLLRRLFLELVLVDKLGLSQWQSTVSCYYLINLIPRSGQVVYLDINDQQLKWREVQLLNNKITWV